MKTKRRRKVVGVRLSEEVILGLQEIARETGRNLSEVVREILGEGILERKQKLFFEKEEQKERARVN